MRGLLTRGDHEDSAKVKVGFSDTLQSLAAK